VCFLVAFSCALLGVGQEFGIGVLDHCSATLTLDVGSCVLSFGYDWFSCSVHVDAFSNHFCVKCMVNWLCMISVNFSKLFWFVILLFLLFSILFFCYKPFSTMLERVLSCLEVYLLLGSHIHYARKGRGCCRYNVLRLLDNITYWGVVTLWVLNVPSQIIEHKNASITDAFTDDSLVYLSCRYHTHTRFTIYNVHTYTCCLLSYTMTHTH
jgi:hypothetical protein